MRRVATAFLLAAFLGGGAGCISSAGGGQKPTGDSTPEKTFDLARDAILAGEPAQVFAQYSERKKQMEGGLENFTKNFERNRSTLTALFTGARVTFVAIEKEQATAVILWGNGERWPPVAYVREKDVWKIDQ